MVITIPICDICGDTESKNWMCQGGYKTCNKCSKDIQDFELQPMKNDNLKILLEVFLRRGKGEEITFKQIHLEKSRFKFFNFMDVWKESNSSKTGKEKQ